MILKPEDISKYGQRVESNVNKTLIETAIQDAELFYLQPMLGDDAFQKLIDLAEQGVTNPLLDGGKVQNLTTNRTTYIAGAKCAIAHIAYSFLIHNKMVATAFGATIKDSEQSHTEDSTKYSKFTLGIGKAHIYKLAEVMNVKCGKSEFQYWEVH